MVTPPADNDLLRALPPQTLAALRPDLEHVELPFHQILHSGQSDERPFVYFLNDGLCSLVIETESGKSAEIGVIGKEGMTSTAAALGVRQNPMYEIMQIGGSGFRIPVEAMRKAMAQDADLLGLVTRFSVLLAMHISQVAGCNRLHSAEQRLARWLLMTQDRVALNPLPLTQEFVAVLLGVTRPSVSATANALKRKGAIELRREKVHILSREKLEQSSCECYRVIAALGAGDSQGT